MSLSLKYRRLCLLLILVLSSQWAYTKESIEDVNLDDIISGFEDDDTNSAEQVELDQLLKGFDDSTESIDATTEELSSPLSLTTLLSVSSSYNYQRTKPNNTSSDFRGLSRLKIKLQPELRWNISNNWSSVVNASAFYDFFFQIKGKDNYESTYINENEDEAEIREAYIRGTLSKNFDIRFGRQIVVWGKSDSIRVVDVLNPLDAREIGMVDIEDLRLPITMIKTDFYTGKWNLSAIIIPEIRFNKSPAFGSDFYVGNTPLPAEEVPSDFSHNELALSLEGIFSGWDISFHFAKFYDDQFHFEFDETNSPFLTHSELIMGGIATNIAYGDWLFKSEVARFSGFEFAFTDDNFDRTDFLAGLDFSGLTDVTLTIEGVIRRVHQYDTILSTGPNSTARNDGQVSFRYSGSFLRDQVNIVFLASATGIRLDDGAFYRGTLEYELADAMSVTLGGVVYQSGNNTFFEKIAQNDRVFIDYRYSF